MRRASTKGRSLLDAAAAYATRYLAGLTTRPVAPTGEALERLATPHPPFPQSPPDPPPRPAAPTGGALERLAPLARPSPQPPADPRSRCAGCWTPSACRAAVRAGS